MAQIEGSRTVIVEEQKFLEKLELEKETFQNELKDMDANLKQIKLFDNYKLVK